MARALGYRIRETGIVWIDREGSRLSMRALVVLGRARPAGRAAARAAHGAAAARPEPLLPEAADQRP